MRRAVNAIIISDGRLLIVRKKDSWILPGGKIEPGESDEECLRREMSEELPKLVISDLRYFAEFIGTTPHSKTELCAVVYLATATGNTKPSAEINASKWTAEPEKFKLSDITSKIIAALRTDGHL